jgi:hypothetical protein
MKNLMIYLSFIGLIRLLFSCEKDETKVIMLTNPVAPTIQTVPDLTLKRASGNDTLVFVGTAVDPGFQASATYFLEACAKGNNFKVALVLVSSTKPTALKITVSNLNGMLLKKFPADQVSSVDLRLRSMLAVDAGTGAPGTSTKPFEYSSEVKNVNVTIYGLPRIDLVGSGMDQKIESALGNGKYSGFVKLDVTNPFTLKDPDSGTVYGANGAALAINGTGLTASAKGWDKLDADTQALTYTMEPFNVGLVGSATPNAWDSPDTKMDYDAESGTWIITLDLIDGEIKFRKNDAWTWNLGGTPAQLTVDGANIAVTAGNYTIVLTITGEVGGTFTITKN